MSKCLDISVLIYGHCHVEEKEEQKPTPGVKVAPVPIPAALRQQDEARRRRALLAPKPIDGIENWGIPPEPDTACDEERAVSCES